ncbi:homocysteine S-methyltransferase [Microcella sp.]|uniref:homocysteine S-methyltransferase n=1 Tax=Microcella sp. TaxID=1913979 RepID=UPI00263680A9|nr:homocysteine S-methyltransferase [Microcella sp.]
MHVSDLASVTVIDGGLGSHLESLGHDLSGNLWSARLLLDDPQAIQAAHRDFFEAGARVAISASYQVSFDALSAVGIDVSTASDLLRRSVKLAQAARDDVGVDGLIAASVGPYGAARADGSEYTGDYDLDRAGLRRWHEPRFEVLCNAGADLLAIETIPSISEAGALLDLLSGSGVPAWVSFTIADGTLRTGESLADAFAEADAVDEIIAMGINCSHPSEVAAALRTARDSTSKPIVVYPNGGETWNADSRRWEGESGGAHDSVAEWLEAGATIIGGCCRVGPADIAHIAAVADEWSQR